LKYNEFNSIKFKYFIKNLSHYTISNNTQYITEIYIEEIKAYKRILLPFIQYLLLPVDNIKLT